MCGYNEENCWKCLHFQNFTTLYSVQAGHILRTAKGRHPASEIDLNRAALIEVDFLALFSPFCRQYHEIYKFTA
ncbi:MAG: hypothetical protein B7Z26_09005 [Asticcacaulis sp. 32-58-5]|nr:MAG: hypothetical protein B7Z26_09005 [Asticcacaulis sp. 32-58-5]